MRTSVIASLLVASLVTAATAAAEGPDAAPATAPAASPAPAGAAAPLAPQATPYPYAPSFYPPPWALWPRPVPLERRSRGMWISGMVLFSAGGIAGTIGAGITIASLANPCTAVDSVPPSPAPRSHHGTSGERVGTARQALNGCDGGTTLGLAVLGGGVLASGLGIPLFLIGNKRVPPHPEEDAAVPELRLGAGSGALVWRF